MTITSELCRQEFIGNDSASTFSVPFRVLDKSHLQVSIDGRALVENTDYTLSNLSAYIGWNVNLIDPAPATFGDPKVLATGETLLMERVLPLTQPASFRSQQSFRAETHEDSLDRLTMIVQQMNEMLVQAGINPFSGMLSGTKDGSNRVFTITGIPNGKTLRQVTVWNNYPLIEGVGYTRSGLTVTFTNAPVADDTLFAQGSY